MASFVFILFLFSSCLISCSFSRSGDFIETTSQYMDGTTGDVLAAFGDFNADKLVDIFVIKFWGKQVDVLLAIQDKPFQRITLISNDSFDDPENITGLIPADFDGDAQMDLLIVSEYPNSYKKLSIYWGNSQNISVDVVDPYKFEGLNFKDDPILFDYNRDMLPDLMTTLKNGSNVVWLGRNVNVRTFRPIRFTGDYTLRVPHACAFADLTGDGNADLLLTTNDSSNYGFYIFDDSWSFSANHYAVNSSFGFVGQSSFADFNLDGKLDHIIPVCADKSCTDSQILVHDLKNDTWRQVLHPLTNLDDNKNWVFNTSLSLNSLNFPFTLHLGDYNMDGYVDIITVLTSTVTHETRPFLLQNVPCSDVSCKLFGREFMLIDILPSVPGSVLLATFFDANEDGTLDILLTALVNNSAAPRIVFLKNNIPDSACFLKVTVLNGRCFKDCGSENVHVPPYGVNVPGPVVRYQMTTAQYNLQATVAAQLSQSAHFSLQLPFVIFGLGQTPNFIDQLDVGIPYNSSGVNRTKQFAQQIIPNSQLIVIPYPVDDPSSWKMQLFVTPSRQMYLTGVSLLATCLLMAVIIAVLQWQEMREDAEEKKQESQKFHFDAM